MATRAAVIDIGTNTLLLLVVDAGATGVLTPVVDLCRFGRLGQGLDRSGVLDPTAIHRSLEICREYRTFLDELGAERVVVIGTQALREASNASEFIGPAQEILGAEIEVIAGPREAELAFVAVAQGLPQLAGQRHVVVDVGGGSTEIILGQGGIVTSAVSLPIGAVRLFERHLRHDPATPEEIAALKQDIAAALDHISLPEEVPLVGTAGTATSMAALHLGLARYDPVAVNGLVLPLVAIDNQLKTLLAMTWAQRRALPGMVPERADVLAAGCAIFSAVAARVVATSLVVCDRGIRWGVVQQMNLH
jgi:exopolyphosphatase/guanosine-5'-triphosphate,3'-diphosphate pyrophosphatase